MRFPVSVLLARCSCLLTILCGPVFGQLLPSTFRFEGMAAGTSSNRPLSNSAVEFLVRGDTVWVAGGKGIDRTTDGGGTWMHFGNGAPFDLEDVAALAGSGPIIWASLAGSEEIDANTTLPKGLGLAVTSDNGATWKRIDQPMEKEGDSTFEVRYGGNVLKALAITTPINNLTYDIAATASAVWIASFAGGLRRSTDGGTTFQPVVLPPDNRDSIAMTDTLDFELSPVDRPDRWNLAGTRLGMRGNLNHRVFSILALSDSVLFVGTAGGINLTTNGGSSWRKFSYSNQQRPISGNFVVALGRNFISGREYIWASTINALELQEYRAISYSSDRGSSWSTALRGEFTNNIGFKDSIVYAATDDGVFRTDDAGKTWLHVRTFVDAKTRNRSTDARCYDAAAQGDVIWVANADGIMKTTDSPTEPFGREWNLFRAAQPLASASDVYVYPNPFSPDDEVARIHYRTAGSGTVTITIYDFAMLPVRTLLRNAGRPPDTEMDEIWDGKDDANRQVANGIYYVQVKLGDNDPAWAKIIALQ